MNFRRNKRADREALVERIAWAIAMQDAQGDEERARGYYRDFPGLYGKRADAALDAMGGTR
jgi:hypothetical protein